MFRLVVLTCVIAAAAAQNVDPKSAKILKEQRFNSGDGRAGSAFATEDGVIFREESDIDGNRIGQYSYIGDNGKTFTVKYSAGKDGFRILSGDHVPADGQDAAAFVAEPIEQPRPAPRAQRPQPLPEQQFQNFQPQQQQQAQPRFVEQPAPIPEPQPVDPNFNPFVNPNDPTHADFSFNKNAARFNPNTPNILKQNLVPECADCENFNPFINPFDATHQQNGHLAGHLAGFRAAAPRQPAAPARPLPQPARPQPAPRVVPTQAPRRFFPPGQLSLNRFETGFNFDFES